MLKRVIPAVDEALLPRNGFSKLGQPLSYSRAPPPDLAPWVGWLYATAVEAPPDHRVECGLLYDSASLRFQLSGQWTALTADGPQSLGAAALHFGTHSRRMPIGVTAASCRSASRCGLVQQLRRREFRHATMSIV